MIVGKPRFKILLTAFSLLVLSSCYEPDSVSLDDIQGFVEQSCTDGVLSGGETGIDCGGPCEPCESCNDGVLNQGETLIDCGGPCPPC